MKQLKGKIAVFKKEQGDLEIPKNYIDKDGYKLGAAYHALRARVKNKSINEEFKKELIEEGLYVEYYSNKKRSSYCAKAKKTIANTSGYIGVGRISEIILGTGAVRASFVQARLNHNKIRHAIGKYEDSEKGLLQGALDRDLYIIEHDLPHRRNFTNEQLIENLYISEYDKKNEVIQKLKKSI